MQPPPLMSRYLAAQAIALEAGGLARRFLMDPKNLCVELKGPQDFVSAADRAVEDLIAARLSAAFPDDAMVGEEGHGAASDATGDALVFLTDGLAGSLALLSGGLTS